MSIVMVAGVLVPIWIVSVPDAIGVELVATEAEYSEDVVARLFTTAVLLPDVAPEIAEAVSIEGSEDVAAISVNWPAGSVREKTAFDKV